MSPRHYFQLFNREARLFLVIGIGVGGLTATVFGIAPAQHSLAGILIPFIMLPVFVGAALGRTVLALETRPASLVVPGLRHQLWRWNTFFALTLAAVFGVAFKKGHHDLPLLVLVPVSAALISAPIVIYPKRTRWITVLPAWAALWLSTFFEWKINSDTVTSFVTQYQLVIGLFCAGIAGWQLRVARDAVRLRGLGLALREESTVTMNAESENWFRGLWKRCSIDSNLSQRRLSVWDCVAAVHREQPGASYLMSLLFVGMALVLGCPLLKDSGGFPLAWYRLVYHWTEGSGPLPALFLWVVLIAGGLLAPMPRRDMLYPIPRRRRAQVAFWSSAGTWLAMLGVWVGGAVLLATLTGWWLHLPMPVTAVVRFAAPAALALPILGLLRWSALRFEGRSEAALWTICLTSFPLTIAGWVLLSIVPPLVSVMLAGVAGAVGLVAYAVALREYFTGEDLIQPLPAKPLFRVR